MLGKVEGRRRRGEYGDEFIPAKPNYFKSKSGAQEAHEAIRPTDVTRTPESLKEFLVYLGTIARLF